MNSPVLINGMVLQDAAVQALASSVCLNEFNAPTGHRQSWWPVSEDPSLMPPWCQNSRDIRELSEEPICFKRHKRQVSPLWRLLISLICCFLIPQKSFMSAILQAKYLLCWGHTGAAFTEVLYRPTLQWTRLIWHIPSWLEFHPRENMDDRWNSSVPPSTFMLFVYWFTSKLKCVSLTVETKTTTNNFLQLLKIFFLEVLKMGGWSYPSMGFHMLHHFGFPWQLPVSRGHHNHILGY